MHRHEFLRGLHRILRPRTYFEVGVNDGRSLSLSEAPTVAVDPAFRVVKEISCDVRLVRATSDEFFERQEPLAHLGGRIDLAFIDGMHLVEYALRDFRNVEKYADWPSVIVLDDVLPRNVDEAARDRHTGAWTGDVYKMISILGHRRPDLTVLQVDTQPTGLLVVLGADPGEETLTKEYDELMAEHLTADPQDVPPEILSRRDAVDPDRLLGAEFWAELVKARDRGIRRKRGLPKLRKSVRKALEP